MITLTFKQAELDKMTAEQLNAFAELGKAIQGGIHPVVGLLTVDPVSEELGTNFLRFSNMQLQIDGLCQVDGKSISILTVISRDEGRGMFTSFLKSLMQHYNQITFICVWSAVVRRKLEKQGFHRFQMEDSDGKKMECYQWKQ